MATVRMAACTRGFLLATRCRTVLVAAALLVVLLAPLHGVGAWDRSPGAEGDNPVVFSPDGRLLVTTSRTLTSDEGLVVWAFPGLKPLRKLPGKDVSSIAFSPDGRLLATGRMEEILTVWEVSTGRLVWKNAERRATERPGAAVAFRSVAFDPTGRVLLTTAGRGRITGRSEDDPYVRWWDSATGEQLRKIRGSVRQVSADGRWLLLQRGAEYEESNALELMSSDGAQVRWSSSGQVPLGFEGQKLYVGTREPGSYRITRVTEIGNDGKAAALSVVDVAEVLPGGLFLRRGSAPRLELVDRTGSAVAVLQHPVEGPGVFVNLADPRGRFIVTGDLRGQAWIWDCRSGRLLLDFNPQSHDFAVSPDGRFPAPLPALRHVSQEIPGKVAGSRRRRRVTRHRCPVSVMFRRRFLGRLQDHDARPPTPACSPSCFAGDSWEGCRITPPPPPHGARRRMPATPRHPPSLLGQSPTYPSSSNWNGFSRASQTQRRKRAPSAPSIRRWS